MDEQPAIPDVSDPDIREMVLSNHEPTEVWEKSKLLAVVCRTCWKAWPCPSIQAARVRNGAPPDYDG
jgi:hypothetical protein